MSALVDALGLLLRDARRATLAPDAEIRVVARAGVTEVRVVDGGRTVLAATLDLRPAATPPRAEQLALPMPQTGGAAVLDGLARCVDTELLDEALEEIRERSRPLSQPEDLWELVIDDWPSASRALEVLPDGAVVLWTPGLDDTMRTVVPADVEAVLRAAATDAGAKVLREDPVDDRGIPCHIVRSGDAISTDRGPATVLGLIDSGPDDVRGLALQVDGAPVVAWLDGAVVAAEGLRLRVSDRWTASQIGGAWVAAPIAVREVERVDPVDRGVSVGDRITLDDEVCRVTAVDGLSLEAVSEDGDEAGTRLAAPWTAIERTAPGEWRTRLPVSARPAAPARPPRPPRRTQATRPARLTAVPEADELAERGAVTIVWQPTAAAPWEIAWTSAQHGGLRRDDAWARAAEGARAREYNRGGRCTRDSRDEAPRG